MRTSCSFCAVGCGCSTLYSFLGFFWRWSRPSSNFNDNDSYSVMRSEQILRRLEPDGETNSEKRERNSGKFLKTQRRFRLVESCVCTRHQRLITFLASEAWLLEKRMVHSVMRHTILIHSVTW